MVRLSHALLTMRTWEEHFLDKARVQRLGSLWGYVARYLRTEREKLMKELEALKLPEVD